MIFDVELGLEVPDGVRRDIGISDRRVDDVLHAAFRLDRIDDNFARRALDLARTHERREEDQGRLGCI